MRINRAARRFGVGFAALSLVTTLVAVPAAGAPAAARQTRGFARDMARLSPSATYEAFVHFRGGTPAERRGLLEARGLQVVTDLGSIDVAIATGEVADFQALRAEADVTYLEENRAVTFEGETSSWATRARVAHETVAGGPFRDPAGAVVDGAGVSVAVVDSGVIGSHPDLANQVVGNFKWVCPRLPQIDQGIRPPSSNLLSCEMVPASVRDSDTTSGHGTHVAGIVAGDGTASRGTFRGVAPGADLYGFGVGEYRDLFAHAAAFDYINENYDDDSIFPTPVKVINNSWADGYGSTHNPGTAISLLIDELVAKGVTLVFAAGNGGGSGTQDKTSSYCKDTTPGVICVANYDDGGTGNRNLALAATSSRGVAGSPTTYPDIGAPGTNITSTCFFGVQPVCLGFEDRWAPFYVTVGGTSMSSPHVAGIAALLNQADPTITPAEIEDVLQDTAFKSTFGAAYEADPQNVGATTSFDKGAGMADAAAALRALGIPEDGVDPGPYDVITDASLDAPGLGAGDVTGVTVTEEATGMRYDIEVRDASATGQFGAMFRLNQNVGGAKRVTTINLTTAGPTIPARDATVNSAVASEATLSGNVVSILVPFGELGSPGSNEIAHNVQVLTWDNALPADMAPGGVNVQSLTAPEFGDAYTIHPT